MIPLPLLPLSQLRLRGPLPSGRPTAAPAMRWFLQLAHVESCPPGEVLTDTSSKAEPAREGRATNTALKQIAFTFPLSRLTVGSL